jgi:hypothetical protein
MFRTDFWGKRETLQPVRCQSRFSGVMHSENLTDALARCLESLDEPAAANPRADFEARFSAELQRLAAGRAPLDGARAEGLLSALGAAKVQEWDLALAFLESARRRPAPGARRVSLSPRVLRQRFHFVMSMGARTPAAR